jgi:hypothetical protein
MDSGTSYELPLAGQVVKMDWAKAQRQIAFMVPALKDRAMCVCFVHSLLYGLGQPSKKVIYAEHVK